MGNPHLDNLKIIPRINDWINDRDLNIIEKSLHGLPLKAGDSPALIIVDAQEAFVGLDDEIEKSLSAYPKSVGKNGWKAVNNIQKLIKTARNKAMPVIFTRLHLDSKSRRYTSFGAKTDLPDVIGFDIVKELETKNEDVIIDKFAASAFFGTHLTSVLNTFEIDTLVIAGFTTSGCVRATAVDAASFNYRVLVVADSVADRLEISHVASLLDIYARYGNVLSTEETNNYLESIT